MIIDTHTHLYLDEFTDKPATIQRAIDAGIGHMIFPNVDLQTYRPMIELHRQFPRHTSVAVGLHPTEIGAHWQSDLDKTLRLVENTPDIVAIGEIGIDLYWDKTYRVEQIEAFHRQMQWAAERNLPAIIHSRDGLEEIIAVLSKFTTPPAAVMHSFTGTADDIRRIREVAPDIYFGINGIVTFKNSHIADVLPEIGFDRLLLETDSPYLAPVPMRGRCNESSYLIHTANFIAERLDITTERLADITTANARRLFGI